jgi:hypothetical protein
MVVKNIKAGKPEGVVEEKPEAMIIWTPTKPSPVGRLSPDPE